MYTVLLHVYYMNLQMNLIDIAFLILILNFVGKIHQLESCLIENRTSIHRITTLTMTASKTA